MHYKAAWKAGHSSHIGREQNRLEAAFKSAGKRQISSLAAIRGLNLSARKPGYATARSRTFTQARHVLDFEKIDFSQPAKITPISP